MHVLLPSILRNAAVQLSLTVRFSVTKLQGDACEWEGMDKQHKTLK